jgi:hypothetical protein
MPLPEHLKSKLTPPALTPVPPTFSAPSIPEPKTDPLELVKAGSTLLLGQTGSGKTDSLLTLIEAGLDLFVASTESNGIETLLRSARRRNVDMSKLHYRHCRPTNMDMASMIKSADQVNRKSVSDMQKVDSPAVLEKAKYRTYINLLENVQNFKCQRTGKEYGDVTQWGDDRAFVIDSLSGVNLMMTQLQVGNRGTLTLPDYNVCQLSLENLIVTLCSCRCFFVLTGHLELEKDQITGKITAMGSTIGQKLAPRLPIHFSEVVRAKRELTSFSWATIDPEADGTLKARALPFSDKLPASFVPIVRAYRDDKAFALDAKEKETENA